MITSASWGLPSVAVGGGFQYHKPTNGGGEPTVGIASISIPIRFPSQQCGAQLFSQSKSLCAEFLCRVRGGLLQCAFRPEIDGGLRWTDDQKHFTDIPSQLVSYRLRICLDRRGESAMGSVHGPRGRNWTPKLDFTDQTLVYGSYAHGYKAGGANPPGRVLTAIPVGGTSKIRITR